MLGRPVRGEVEFIEKGTAPAPDRILTTEQKAPIPTLKLRLRADAGQQVQVLFRGDAPGHVDVGDRIRAKGLLKGGLLRADSLFNETTKSWVTPRACFIATAAAGQDSEEVRALRELRDVVLLGHAVGRCMVLVYEHVSPPLAGVVSRSDRLRDVARRYVVAPAAAVARRIVERVGGG